MEHTSTEKLSEAFKLLEEAAKHQKDELKNAMQSRYVHLKNAILETESTLAKSLSEAGKHAVEATAHARDIGVDKAREIAGDVDKNVHRNPWPYIGGMAVVGLLLGYILSRNRD